MLKDILLYLRKEDFKTFRKVSRKCAAVSFDGGTLNARGTEFYLAQKSDLPLLAMHLLKGRCAGVPITCTDLSIADNDLAYLTQAIDVDLRCCTLITDAGLTSLKNTTTINLCGCNIGDAGLVHLEKAKEIILSHCPITDAGLVSLSHAESVNLWKCAFVKDEGLAFLANIHTIDLSYCTITDAGLSHLKRAKDVTLKGCTTLTRNGFAHLANALTVDLSACTQLTNDDLAFFANVEDITLRACNITDAGLLSLQKVKRINLAQCPGVTQGAKDQLRARGVEVID
ncbi:MAG: hypothetical protein LCH26_06035 [Proteobacteria bacterium]|nr:hypothetical protein [Pseudomonadota bacterium]